MLTVDGDSSTNDTFLAFANGRAGNPVIDDRSPMQKRSRPRCARFAPT